MQYMFWLGYPSSPESRRFRTPLIAAASLTFLISTACAAPTWQLVWADEFDVDGPPNPANWTYDLGGGGWGNQEIQVYTDSLDNARVEGGRLIIEARQVESAGRPIYTSARLVTRGLHAWQYGRIEARARMPRTTGTWSAIWMLSEDQIFPGAFWPDNGEIDIVEHVGYEEDPLFHSVRGSVPDNVHGTLHTFTRNGRDNTGLGGRTFVPGVTEEFQDYAINWFPDRIEFEVNGLVYFTAVKEDLIPVRNPPPPEEIYKLWPFDQRFHLILNVAVGGSWGGHFNSTFYPTSSPFGPLGVDHNGEWPQRMEVEYVRVYALADDAWRGFPRVGEDFADTGDWLGMLYVAAEPWVYAFDHGWLFMPEPGHAENGGWIWRPRPSVP